MEITLKSIRTIFTKSKNTDQSDTTTEYANGSTTTPTNSASSEPFEYNRIQNTPFTVVGNKTQGYWIGYGHAQITDKYKTKKQAIRALNTNFWNVICNIMTYTTEHWQKLKEHALRHDDGRK